MSTNCYYTIEVAIENWDDQILNSEETTATTTDLLAQNLNTIYADANDELNTLAASVANDSKSDDINQDQAIYNEASTEYQNLETTYDSIVQSSETTSSQLSQDSQQAVSFSSAIMQDMSYVSNLLAQA